MKLSNARRVARLALAVSLAAWSIPFPQAAWQVASAAASPRAPLAPIEPGKRLAYTVKGTPHDWLADEQGTLHWIGDSIALSRLLYKAQEYTLAEPLDPGLRRSLAGPIKLTHDELMAARRGEPLLSTSFVEWEGAVYYPRWEAFSQDPLLLRVASAEELRVLGVTDQNRGTLVLPAPEWEQRYKKSLASLPQDELRPTGPQQPRPLPCVPTVDELQPLPTGAMAHVTNRCAEPLQVQLSAVLYDTQANQPVATTLGTTFMASPGQTQAVRLTLEPPPRPRLMFEGMAPALPTPEPAPPRIVRSDWARPMLNAAPVPPEQPPRPAGAPALPPELEEFRQRMARQEATVPPVCVDVGGAGCLRVDPRLLQTVEVLAGVESGRSLLSTAADFGVSILRGPLFGVLGQYSALTRTVRVSSSLDDQSDWERATVVAHELQHAADHSAGKLLSERGSISCLEHEQDAFSREAEVWNTLWQGNLPEPRDRIQRDLNQSVKDANDPQAQQRTLAHLYADDCVR